MWRGRFYVLAALLLAITVAGWAEFQVNEYTEHDQTYPAVAMNEAGDFAVAWRSHQCDGRGGGVYVRRFLADGTPACGEFKANVFPVNVDGWTPAIAITPTGDIIVVWVAMRDGNCDVMARSFDPQGTPITEEFQVNEPDSGAGQSMPSIAMSPAGGFVVVWTNWSEGCSSGKSHVMGRVYAPDCTPQTRQFVVSDNTNADWPDVAMDASGRFTVAWIRMGDMYNRPYGEYILFRRYQPDGTPACDPVQITTDLNSRWYGPSVAAADSGEFIVTWAIGPFPYDIVAQDFDANGVATTQPYMVNTCREGNQGHPRVAGNGRGDFLVVWDSQGQSGSGLGVLGQQCMCTGEFAGGECLMASCADGRQWYPDVAVEPTGRYVVVWISEGQDGSGYGIFGQMGQLD
jgi:hypothetical protein